MKKFLYGNRECQQNRKGRVILVAIFLGMAMVCSGCRGNVGRKNPVQHIDTAMGTIVSQTLYGVEDTMVSEAMLQMVAELERESLSWRLDGSEISDINKHAGREEGITLSTEMQEILANCLEVSRQSQGAFDITIGEVVRLWDIDSWAGLEDVSGYTLPSESELQEGLAQTGYEKLTLQGNTLYLPQNMQLDLGAVGKGIALDRLLEYLQEQETVTGAVLSVGGSILTYGAKPEGGAWRVGVVNPMETSANLGYLELEGQWCISTSGDYERFVELDGVRYHHIIDPATGRPADSGLKSVTIATKDGLLSDALSTACFILGREEGSKLVDAFGAEALFVDGEGNITMTDGMEQYFHLSK